MKSVNLCRWHGQLAVGDQLTPSLTRANRDELLSACLHAYIMGSAHPCMMFGYSARKYYNKYSVKVRSEKNSRKKTLREAFSPEAIS